MKKNPWIIDRGIKGRIVQLDFSAAFGRVNHRGLLYKLRSIGAGGLFLFLVSKFLSDKRQPVRLNGKVSASAPPRSSALLGTMLWAMQMILQSMQLILDRKSVLKR